MDGLIRLSSRIATLTPQNVNIPETDNRLTGSLTTKGQLPSVLLLLLRLLSLFPIPPSIQIFAPLTRPNS